jgi:hypothetical protein
MFQTNFVMKLMAAANEWEELQATASPSTVSGTYEYTNTTLSLVTPQRIYSIELYKTSQWQPPMIEVSEHTWRTQFAPGITIGGGAPCKFARFAGKYFFYPNPDDAYLLRIEYLSKITEITGVTSTISLTDKDELIVALTTGIMWLTQGDTSMFDKWMGFSMPLIEQFNIDSHRIMNFISPGNRGSSRGQTWQDPFSRR